MANLNLQDSSNIKVVQNGSDISLDFTSGGLVTQNTTNIGTLANLTTTDKTDLVSAINEVNKASNFMVVSNSAVQTLSTANSQFTYNLDTLCSSNGSLLSFSSANHQITIGAGVNHIEVSAKLLIATAGTAGLKNIYVYKYNANDGETLLNRGQYYTSQSYTTMTTGTTIVPVSPGDVIYMKAMSANGTTTGLSGDSTGTLNNLVVRVID